MYKRHMPRKYNKQQKHEREMVGLACLKIYIIEFNLLKDLHKAH